MGPLEVGVRNEVGTCYELSLGNFWRFLAKPPANILYLMDGIPYMGFPSPNYVRRGSDCAYDLGLAWMFTLPCDSASAAVFWIGFG